MKAKLVSDQTDVNPLYSKTLARLARVRNEVYDEPQFLVRKAGDIIDSPVAWIPCVGATPTAVPFDSECKTKVASISNSPRRKAFLRSLLQFHQTPRLVDQLGADGKKYIKAMLEAYESELNALSDQASDEAGEF